MLPGDRCCLLDLLTTPCAICSCPWWVSAAAGGLGGGTCGFFFLSRVTAPVHFTEAHVDAVLSFQVLDPDIPDIRSADTVR